MAPIRFIDLFAGTGGFAEALEGLGGFECVYANDMEKSSQKIYSANHPNTPFELGSIMDIGADEIPEHDMLCGGFPCQPFSIAGQRLGFDDERSNVFWKIIDIITFHLPSIVLLENVKNLKSHNKGETYKIIKSSLEECGYVINSNILDTAVVTNIPHHRERIYILGIRKDIKLEISLDFPRVDTKKLSDMLETKPIDKSYYYDSRFKVFPEIEKSVIRNVIDGFIYQYRRYYVRESKSGNCPTLTANMGSGGHNVPIILDSKNSEDVLTLPKNAIRKLTPRECFNLQGFRKNYILPDISDNKLYKLAGNAISVPVVTLVGKKILQTFRKSKLFQA